MPDSFGKRNRDVVKARKAAARDERRIARNERHRNRGIMAEQPPEHPADTAIEEDHTGIADISRGA